MSTHQSPAKFPVDGEAMSRLLVVAAGLSLLGLAGCQTSPGTQIPAPPAAVPAPEVGAPFPGAREYRVIAEESLLQIFAYRGGAMARLGHNHVIASRHLDGVVYLTGDLLQTRFDVSFPVNELTVDEPALREQAGPDFPPSVPQSARDGTRRNLLSEAMLDAERFPTIRLRALEVVATATSFEAGVEITIKDQTRQVRVPVEVERSDGQILARGEFPLKQSELGLVPFTAALGALAVLDDMKVRFELTVRDQAAGTGTD
jgi:hypothetical protein